jgi:hypothetical protein
MRVDEIHRRPELVGGPEFRARGLFVDQQQSREAAAQRFTIRLAGVS